ncbi:MAG TPA: bile acid:sodium symporter [Streptosporangiaceae bacterium]|nr:bile acid:sodium symporter [Streptosporangiaceae bacterium]
MASSDGVIGLQPRLAGVSGFLDRFLLPLVLIIAGLGVALPEPGRRLDAGGAILITLAVLVFCTGSSVTFADIGGMRAAAGRMALVLAASTVILPLLAWLASRLVSGPALQGGVLAAGVAPVEVASVALTGMAGGEVVVAVGLLIASTLLTVLLAGPILGLLGAHSAVSQLGLLATLALVVALPLIAGCAMRTLDPFGGRDRSLIEVLGMASLLLLLWESSSELRLHASDGRVAVALLVFLAGAGGLGWLLARGAPRGQRTAMILPTTMRDFAVAAGIAASAFGIAAAAPMGIYGVMVLVFGAITVYVSKRA